MENSGLWVQKECHRKNDSLHSLCNDRELSDEDSSKSQFKKLIKRSNSHHAIVVNAIQSQISKVCFKDLFFRRVHGLDKRIPKHMVSVDEKYLRRCLEFVHNSALKATQCSIPSSLSATNEGILSESLIAAKFFGGSGRLVFECPVTTETGRVAISADTGEQWKLGTVMRSKSMINILNSALLQKFGVSDRNGNLNRLNFIDAKGPICYDFIDSSSDLSISSSYKETPLVQGHKYGSISVHKRFPSTSTINSTCSDWLSSPSSTLSQGMIQCTWEHGVPHFVFCADDQKEVYVSKLMKVDSTDDKSLDYVYQFRLSKRGQKGREIPDSGQLVGKMNVSTSFTFCPNKCRIIETQFTLFGNTEIYDGEIYATSHSHKKNKGLSKKMSQVFRTSPSLKHRTFSKFGGSSSTPESCPWEPHALAGTNFLDANVPPNFELATIVVKEHLPCKKTEKVGGWGLNFLNKPGVNQSTLPTESCSRNTGDCSTSTDIVIPAGLHGGPRTRNCGPSSLIDRWRSESQCDCGGWDEGCPLTVLQRRSSNAEVLSQVDRQAECKTVDIVTQGSSNFSPTLRMVNVRDGLYFIHFQLPLSALQSFSIAVAIIHAQSPCLRPNAAQKL
ncbi:hypothetical protein TanjilG_03909 [Lupinus angustifolius]|uniref:Uncharacterized protein n=1 Tax=Lupinus angustifolius TaxID=3871 RepID=A0A4P1R5Q1_LUPAN|nr:PREDICTED: uncharacterized protein LOC109361028 [Lupinus angustifolius]XP_019461859.1 PREDICTED: uncharacterized protein LOC109361028 [Lupinus angustifolius]OIW01771.1 hypothetical protein TanjilG_03909 [Lupinus angustifolius]